MKRFIKLHLCLCLLAVLCVPYACGECMWGDYVLSPAEGRTLDKAKAGIQSFRFLPTDEADGRLSVQRAIVRPDRVLIWFNPSNNSGSMINVYSLKGDYEYGYRIFFKADNGMHNMNYFNGSLLVYSSGAARCIYQMDDSGHIAYWNAPTDFLYTGSAESEKTGFSKTHSIRIEGLCKVVISDLAGNETVIFDKNKEHAKFHPPLPKWIETLGIILLAIACTIAFVIMSVDTVKYIIWNRKNKNTLQ